MLAPRIRKILFTIVVLVCAYFFLQDVRDIFRERSLKQRGSVANGTLAGTKGRTVWGGARYLVVDFVDANGVARRVELMHRGLRIAVGQDVKIVYLSDSPDTAELLGGTHVVGGTRESLDLHGHWLMAVSVLAACLGWYLIYKYRPIKWKEAR